MELVERVARAIAQHHGGKIIYYRDDNTAVTIARQRGYKQPWIQGVDEYVKKRWGEYIQAAEVAIEIVRRADAEGPKT